MTDEKKSTVFYKYVPPEITPDMVPTSDKYCNDCKYVFKYTVKNGKIPNKCCQYILKTGEKRNCPVGYCNKKEPLKKSSKRNKKEGIKF